MSMGSFLFANLAEMIKSLSWCPSEGLNLAEIKINLISVDKQVIKNRVGTLTTSIYTVFNTINTVLIQY